MTAITTQQFLPALGTGSLNGYLDAIAQIPILTPEEETNLFRKFHEENDLDAARQIVMSHLRYVAYVARSYSGYGLPLEDLIQQGNVGLMKSVKKFDRSHGVRLVSFAVHWIKAEIHEYILKNWKIVKVATTKAQRKLFFNLRSQKNRLGWFNNAEVEAVAEDLGVKPEEVMEMEARLSNFDQSFEVSGSDDDEEGASFGPSAYLTRGEEEDPALVVAEEELSLMQSAGLTEALSSLDPRSRDIVESRWLTDQKAGLKELSERYGVSMERIRQIEAKAFEKMMPYLQAAA
ncbi:MAG: RNA polymerase sigma factor RpoH [Pseudomonadota bacterium]